MTDEDISARGEAVYKYDRLGEYLRGRNADRVTLTFDDIADIIGDELPESARRYAAWWANDPKHSQAKAWLDEDYKTEALSLAEERVTFVRG